jgi:hypothetical protein
VKVAVIQHRLRAHERMDLAALLALAQEASDDGASVIVCPAVPGMPRTSRVFQAFVENMNAHAPGSLVISPLLAALREEENGPLLTPLGRTVALLGDDCFDPGCHERLQGLRLQALVWQADAESPLQAEAVLEVALDASLSLAPLVLVAAVVGRARGVSGHGAARSSTSETSWPRRAMTRRSCRPTSTCPPSSRTVRVRCRYPRRSSSSGSRTTTARSRRSTTPPTSPEARAEAGTLQSSRLPPSGNPLAPKE